MQPSRIGLAALLVAALACSQDRPKLPRMADALPNLPLPPRVSFVSRTGGPDALQVTVRSANSPESVTNYYRTLLNQGGWKLVNEAKDQEGATVLYAQQKGPPLWVRIRPAEDGAGTLVDLTGAVVKPDSAAAQPAKPKS
jgi:hypothetical protein